MEQSRQLTINSIETNKTIAQDEQKRTLNVKAICKYTEFNLIITLVYRDRRDCMTVWEGERFIAILPTRLVSVARLFVSFPPRLITGWSRANVFSVSTVLLIIAWNSFSSYTITKPRTAKALSSIILDLVVLLTWYFQKSNLSNNLSKAPLTYQTNGIN